MSDSKYFNTTKKGTRLAENIAQRFKLSLEYFSRRACRAESGPSERQKGQKEGGGKENNCQHDGWKGCQVLRRGVIHYSIVRLGLEMTMKGWSMGGVRLDVYGFICSFHTRTHNTMHEYMHMCDCHTRTRAHTHTCTHTHTHTRTHSSLFAEVINCMQTDNLELKKLVYLYLMNYAKSQPDLAILAVNTFAKDCDDPNPLIRALAVRTMGCIRVDKITEYLCEPLRKCLKVTLRRVFRWLVRLC